MPTQTPSSGTVAARSGSTSPRSRSSAIAGAAAPTPGRMTARAHIIGITDDARLNAKSFQRVTHRAEIGAAGIDQGQRGHRVPLVARQFSAFALDRLAQRARQRLEAGLDLVVVVVALHLQVEVQAGDASHSERKKCGTSSVGRSPTRSRLNSPSNTKYGRPLKSSAALARVSSIGRVKP
jgi:hypothetical protein